jgi:hypothetical protein
VTVAADPPAESRWLITLFAALAVLYCIPIWSVAHLPTSDGPSHLYNSWILRELIAGNSGPIARYFVIDAHPYPNWTGHAVLALLMCIVSPVVAEKILVSGIVLLFLAAAWMYSGTLNPAGRLFAFLAFPLAYNRFLQAGLYNFSLGVGICLCILPVWWRRRDLPNAKTVFLIVLLLLLCYFSHPLPTLVAMGSIGLLWLLTLRGRRFALHARHLLAFVPAMALLIWFGPQEGTGITPNVTTLVERAIQLVRGEAILTFDRRQYFLGTALFASLLALAVITSLRGRLAHDARPFVVVTAAVLVVYFVYPQINQGGLGAAERTTLFIYLLPTSWLWSDFSKALRAGLVALLAIVAAANLFFCSTTIGRPTAW